MGKRLFIAVQYAIPQHTVSRVVLVFTRLRIRWLKNLLIGAFVRHFKPRMQDAAQSDPLAYASFNEFFTRALRAGIRPAPIDPRAIASPVDGAVSASGPIDGRLLLQAKSHRYTVEALLAGNTQWAQRFADGAFTTIYLAPFDYHRIHMPLDGALKEAWYVPGKLFSVNTVTAESVPGLFARNERVVLLFEGSAGPWALVFVGALNVGSMSTVWHGDVTPRRPRRVTQLTVPPDASLPRGAEVGRFNMGSTVILLWAKDRVQLAAGLDPGCKVQLGQEIGRLT
jgi:phosphatidylserine decarboxylase